MRRPDRLRVDATQRNGVRRSLYFDGQKVSIDLPDDQGYVEVEKPGTLDAVIDYLVDDLQTPAPLHEFVKSNYFADAEIELAFTTLFGTFGRPFFDRYEEIRPLRPGFHEERRHLLNLYPLMLRGCGLT